MDSKIINFLKKERVCALSVILPNGAPHSAAVHYSHEENPLIFFIQTSSKSQKCSGLLNGEIVKASVVVGFSEEDWLTLQMRGDIKIISDHEELDKIYKIHYAKHPNAEKYKSDAETVFLEFVPSWWRYTDFNTDPETIIEK